VKKGQSLDEQFARTLSQHSGSAAKNANNKDLKNVGPSVQYKLRDKTGQAREFLNYMQPVTLEGAQVYLAGVRSNPSDPVQLPAHPGRRQARRARMDAPARRAGRPGPARGSRAPLCRARPAAGPGEAALARASCRNRRQDPGDLRRRGQRGGGFVAVSQFLERIPQAEQEKAANVFMKMLNGAMWELWQAARCAPANPPVEASEAHGRFLQLATNALSDSFFYGAPVYLRWKSSRK
jgi:cytochrome c biogenesis protein